MGIRYERMLPAADVSHLSPTLRALIKASRAAFVNADRGHVRRANDTTVGTRANLVARWLDTSGFNELTASNIRPPTFLDILGAFIRDVKAGFNCQCSLLLSDATVRNYLLAAAAVLHIMTRCPCDIAELLATASSPSTTLPYLRELIGQRKVWKQPKQRKETYTLPMFSSLRDVLRQRSQSENPLHVFCSKTYVVYDWSRLGVFTGSRIAEYGQSKIPKGQRFATVPKTTDAGQWAGLPIAFIASDFTFYNAAMIQQPQSHTQEPKKALLINEVHLRFRFDMSLTNFSIRKYRRQAGAPFDAVQPIINIFRRAYVLRIPPDEPIGQYGIPGSPASQFNRHCIRDYHVRDVMRQACRDAYPNPLHYCRIHINSIVAHSNRITAAVCLKMGGATDEEIAFRLRWHISSVPTYLRDCITSIDALMQQAIAGAILNT